MGVDSVLDRRTSHVHKDRDRDTDTDTDPDPDPDPYLPLPVESDRGGAARGRGSTFLTDHRFELHESYGSTNSSYDSDLDSDPASAATETASLAGTGTEQSTSAEQSFLVEQSFDSSRLLQRR